MQWPNISPEQLLAGMRGSPVAIDGDTTIDGDGNRIRTAGVDAPELETNYKTGEAGGDIARVLYQEQLDKGTTLEKTGEHTYNRDVGVFRNKDGEDVSNYLTSVGADRITRFSNEDQKKAATTNNMRWNGVGAMFDDPAAIADMNRVKEALKSQAPIDPYVGRQAIRGGNGTFTGAVARGVDNMQADFYGATNALGEVLKIDPIAEFGEDGMRRNMMEAATNPAEINSTDDIHSLADAGTYALEAIGEQVPNIALMALGGESGALIARAAIGKSLIEGTAAKMALKYAPAAGAGAVSYPLGVGDLQMELKGAHVHAPGTALLAGLPIAGLDAVGFEYMLGSLFHGSVPSKAAKSMVESVAKGFGVHALHGVAAEMPTEMAQEFVAIAAHAAVDPNFQIYTPANMKRIKEAGIKGGLVGGLFGGVAGGITGAREHNVHTKSEDNPAPSSDGQPPTGGEPNTPDQPAHSDGAVPAQPEDIAPQGPISGEPGEVNPNDSETSADVAQEAPTMQAHLEKAGASATQHDPAMQAHLEKTGAIEATPTEGATPAEQAMTPEQEQMLKDLLDKTGATTKERLGLAAIKKKRAAMNSALDQGADHPTRRNVPTDILKNQKTVIDESVHNKVDNEAAIGLQSLKPRVQYHSLGKETFDAAEDGSPNTSRVIGYASKADGSPSDQATKVRNDLAKQHPESDFELVKHKGKYVIKETLPPKDMGSVVDDDVKVRRQIQKIFRDGRSDKKAKLAFAQPNGKYINANAPEIAKLGKSVREPGSETGHFAQDYKNNFLSGVSLLMDRGYTPKNNIDANTVIHGTDTKLSDFNTGGRVQSAATQLDNAAKTLEDTVGPDATDKEPTDYKHKFEWRKELRAAKKSYFDAMRELTKHGLSSQDVTESLSNSVHEELFGEPRKVDEASGQGETEQMAADAAAREDNKPNPVQASTAKPKEDISAISAKADAISKGKQVYAHGNISEKSAQLTEDLLQHVGVKQQVVLMDEAGVEAALKNPGTSETLREELKRVLVDKPQGRIIYNDTHHRGSERYPVIFVSSEVTVRNGKNTRALLHEIGHLVQRVALDTAPDAVKKKFEENRKLSGDNTVFKEWFANQLMKWATSREKPSSMLDKFFHGLANTLRKVWSKAKRLMKPEDAKLDETFTDFMDAMVATRMERDGIKGPETKLGKEMQAYLQDLVQSPFMPKRVSESAFDDFTPEDVLKGVKKVKNMGLARLAAVRKGKRLSGEHIVNVLGELKDRGVKPLHTVMLQSIDSYMRNLKDKDGNPSKTATMIANHWRHRAGDKHVRSTIHEDEMRIKGPLDTKLRDIANEFPRLNEKMLDKIFNKAVGLGKEGRLDKNATRYKELGKMLLSEAHDAKWYNENGYPEAAMVRDYMDHVLKTLRDEGLDIKNRKNYFPHMLDVARILDDEANFRGILHEMGVKDIDAVMRHLRASNGVVLDLNHAATDGDIIAPAFGFMQQRSFTPEEQAQLMKYYNDDVIGIMTNYTHSAVHRAVIQQHFNPTGMKTNESFQETENGKVDPLLDLNVALHRAQASGELTYEEIARIRDKVLPSYFGRLGADGDPGWRALSGFGIAYQNIRLLSLVVLSSFVDVGLGAYRVGDMGVMSGAIQDFLGKQSRADLYEMGHMIGSIQDGVTEHILTDPVTQQFIAPEMRMANEYFFRLVKKHQWTNFTRELSLAAGKRYLVKHADGALAGKKASIHALEELGITPEQVQNQDPVAYTNALNRFIDESVLRPDAGMRPVWANDPNFMLLAHLKPFLWAYHEVVLRRVWAQSKDKNIETLQAALPLMYVAMATLPLAALGYDLRQRVSYWGEPPARKQLQGFDYFWEMIQRSGMLGVFQMYADASTAERHGRFSLISLMGPTAGQFEEFVTKDFGYFAARAVPIFAQSAAARQWMLGKGH